MDEPLDQSGAPEQKNKSRLGRAVMVNFGIAGCFALLAVISSGSDSGASIGMFCFLQAIFNLFFGFFMVLMKQTRQVGAGMLLSGFLLCIIGAGVCSYSPVNFH
jgi:hypothetical protein